MSKVIRIDNEVYKNLQIGAVANGIPFTNPNNVLRIMLGLSPLKSERHKPKK